MIYIEKKYLIIIVFLFVVFLFNLLFFDNKITHNLKDKEHINKVITKKDNNTNIKIDYQNEKITKVNNKINITKTYTNNNLIKPSEDIESEQLEEKKEIISKNSTKDSKYIVSIVSDKKIKGNYIGNYVPIKGTIIVEDKQNNFTISLPKNYKENYELTLNLEVYNLSKDKTMYCDGYFLRNLEDGFLYDLNIELYDDYANCYISGNVELPKIAMPGEDKNKPLNLDHLSERFKQKDLTIIE